MRYLLSLLLCACLVATASARDITKGSTDQRIYLTIIDQTTGIPDTSLTFESSGIALEYVRNGEAVVSIPAVTQTASGTHADGGFVYAGAGCYRLDVPDAAFATGADSVVIGGSITGKIVMPCEVQLTGLDLQGTVQLAELPKRTEFAPANELFDEPEWSVVATIVSAVEALPALIEESAPEGWAEIKTLVELNLDGKVSEAVTAAENAELAAENVEGAVVPAVTADRVPKQLTFYVGSEGNKSRNIVKINAFSTGSRTLAYDLTELLKQSETTLLDVTSVTVVKGETTIAVDNERMHQNKMIAMWDIDPISTANAGKYTVTVTCTTLDSNTIVLKGTLEVE